MKVDISLSNFPSLIASNWTEDSFSKSSPYGKILEKASNQKVSKIQPSISETWGNEKSNHVHTGFKPGSTKEIIKLCKHFPSLQLKEIKTVYSMLDEDFEATIAFFLEKKKDSYQPVIDKKKNICQNCRRLI